MVRAARAGSLSGEGGVLTLMVVRGAASTAAGFGAVTGVGSSSAPLLMLSWAWVQVTEWPAGGAALGHNTHPFLCWHARQLSFLGKEVQPQAAHSISAFLLRFCAANALFQLAANESEPLPLPDEVPLPDCAAPLPDEEA